MESKLQELLNTPLQQHGVNWEQQASVASPGSVAPAVTPSATHNTLVVLNEEPLPLWVKFMPWFGAGLMAVSSICWLIEISRPVQAVAQYSQPLAHYQQQAPKQPPAAKPSPGQRPTQQQLPQVQSVLGDASQWNQSRFQDWVNWCADNNGGRGWPGGEVHVCEAIHRQLGYDRSGFQ